MNFAERTKAKLNELVVQESLEVAARDILSPMSERIFERGEDKTGASIGSYKTYPIYISKREMRNTSGGRETKGGKSKFFQGGYKEYKDSLGDSGNFNLRNFGRLMSDFKSPAQTLSGLSIKYQFKQERSKNIAYVERYDNVWGLSVTETETFNKTFIFEIAKRLFND